MIDNVEKYVDFLEEHDLNGNQFTFCYLLAVEDFNSLVKYTRNKPLSVKELDQLVIENKIIITKWDKNNPKYNLKTMRISEAFKKRLTIDKEDAANEIWEAYFKYGYWDHQKVVARDIIFDEFVDLYDKTIKGSKQEHLRILNITKKYVKSRQYAEKGLKKYIGTRMYDIIEDDLTKRNELTYGEDDL